MLTEIEEQLNLMLAITRVLSMIFQRQYILIPWILLLIASEL